MLGSCEFQLVPSKAAEICHFAKTLKLHFWFWQAQMVRRVKTYLNNMTVIEDEAKLNEMSTQCEPIPCE